MALTREIRGCIRMGPGASVLKVSQMIRPPVDKSVGGVLGGRV